MCIYIYTFKYILIYVCIYTSYSKAKHSFFVLCSSCMLHAYPTLQTGTTSLASLQVAWNTVQTLVLLRSFIPMLHHQQTILWNWSLTMLWPTNLQWIIVGLVFGHHNILWEDQDSLLPQKPVIPGVSHPKSCEFFLFTAVSAMGWRHGARNQRGLQSPNLCESFFLWEPHLKGSSKPSILSRGIGKIWYFSATCIHWTAVKYLPISNSAAQRHGVVLQPRMVNTIFLGWLLENHCGFFPNCSIISLWLDGQARTSWTLTGAQFWEWRAGHVCATCQVIIIRPCQMAHKATKQCQGFALTGLFLASKRERLTFCKICCTK